MCPAGQERYCETGTTCEEGVCKADRKLCTIRKMYGNIRSLIVSLPTSAGQPCTAVNQCVQEATCDVTNGVCLANGEEDMLNHCFKLCAESYFADSGRGLRHAYC